MTLSADEEAIGGEAQADARFTSVRYHPRELHQGDLGTLADAINGDIVVVGSLDGRRAVIGEVAWRNFDGSVQVHLGQAGDWHPDLSAVRLVRLAGTRAVRFWGLRPWTNWHGARDA